MQLQRLDWRSCPSGLSTRRKTASAGIFAGSGLGDGWLLVGWVEGDERELEGVVSGELWVEKRGTDLGRLNAARI